MVLVGEGVGSIDGVDEQTSVVEIIEEQVAEFFGQIKSGEISQEQGLALIEKALLALRDSNFTEQYLKSIEVASIGKVELYDSIAA